MDDNENQEDEQKPLLADWAVIAQPASLSTKPGKQRFLVTIKLPEKSPKTATNFVNEMNDALKAQVAATRGCELTAQFVLVDSERTRLQRATAGFSTFKDAQTCLRFLKELGLPTNDISPEFEDFGNKKYDPWFESVSQSWWPWLAAWRNPAPEMPMMKVTNRLDLTAGGKYKEGASGKLGKSDEVDRNDAPPEEAERVEKKRGKKKPRREEDQEEEAGDEVDRNDAQPDENERGEKKRSKKKPRKEEGQEEGKPRRKKKADESERSED